MSNDYSKRQRKRYLYEEIGGRIMPEIKCPKCGTTFTIDEDNYDSIVRQIRNDEFDKELKKQLEIEHSKHNQDLEIVKQQQINSSNAKISELEKQIAELKSQIKLSESESKLKINEAVNEKEQKILKLTNDLNSQKANEELRIKELEKQNEILLKAKDKEIDNLR